MHNTGRKTNDRSNRINKQFGGQPKAKAFSMRKKAKQTIKHFLPMPVLNLYNKLWYNGQQIVKLKNEVFEPDAKRIQKLRSLYRILIAEEPRHMPKVSRIVPVYNARPYLCQCIDSILMQELYDYELICVDDASTDGSAELLEQYAGTEQRMKIIRQAKSNAGEARNKGIGIAKGEYLAFLDADDFFQPMLLQRLYETCDQHKADICLCSGYQYNDSTGECKTTPSLLDKRQLPTKNPFSPKDCPGRIFQITTPCPWSKLFRRSFIEANGLMFQSVTRANDLLFVYGAIALSERIAVCVEPLVIYRINAPNSLQSQNSETPLEFYKALAALQELLKERGAYARFEQSFSNMALDQIVYHVNTQTSPVASAEVLSASREKYEAMFGISGRSKEDFDRYVYRRYMKIIKQQSNKRRASSV